MQAVDEQRRTEPNPDPLLVCIHESVFEDY